MTSLSPRQVADALGVSESSLKRWCDQGLLATTKTAGGHRRLSLDAVTEFLRTSARPLGRPELLGLPSRTGRRTRAANQSVDDFCHALLAGEEPACRRILLDMHLAGLPLARICDEVITEALRRAGTGWECGEVQVYQERRGCGICLRLLHELGGMLTTPDAKAPLAVGAAPENDPYQLPTAMVELVFRQAGWRALSLGSGLPFATLAAAIHDLQPRLFWLSVSHVADEARFLREYGEFHAQVRSNVIVVVGGRALTDALRQRMHYAAFCDTLKHLEAFTEALQRT